MIRINLIVNSFPVASETFLFNLVTGLEQKGIDVTVIASAHSLHTALFKDRMNEWTGKIDYLKISPFKYFFHYLTSISKNYILFINLLKKQGWRKSLYFIGIFESLVANKPDILHFAFSGIAVQYLPILSALNMQAKTIVSCRGTGEKVKPIVDSERKKRLALLFQSVHRVHSVSEDILNTVIHYGLNKKKAFVNRPAIQIENFLFSQRKEPSDSEPYIIVTTGRLDYQKGYVFALLALQYLSDKGKFFEYHILGDGPDREQLQYLIYEFGLQEKVHLHGKVSAQKVCVLLNQAHIFLLPSIYEGISNAALEAMAMGVPLISTNAGGMMEVIQNGVNGVVVPTFNSVAIFDAILYYMDNYQVALAMAKEAYVTIQINHRMEQQIESFIHEYKLLVSTNN